jgi:hypothetical protein
MKAKEKIILACATKKFVLAADASKVSARFDDTSPSALIAYSICSRLIVATVKVDRVSLAVEAPFGFPIAFYARP